MFKRKKDSGHSNRIKKAKRVQENAELRNSMNQFVNIVQRTSTSTTEKKNESIETSEFETNSNNSESSDVECGNDGEFSSTTGNESDLQNDCEREHESEKPIEPIVHDPYTWPDILSEYFREKIVKSGLPTIPNRCTTYPQQNGRSFNNNIFYATHTNGSHFKREWLIYSKSSDSVYCLFCALFNQNSNRFCATGRGYSDWKNIKREVANHENSFKHHSAFKSWLEFSKRLKTNQTIDSLQQKLLSKEIDRWKEVMKRLVASVQFLAQQSLAFRGHTNKLYDKNNGNFLKLIEMIAKFDPVMADHVNRATTTSKRHYLSSSIQNDLIDCLATSTK